MKEPSVHVILLNFNYAEDTIECINSLKKIDYSNYEIVVVDNASKTEDVEKLRKIKGIVLIENKENFGFAGGNNVGIRYAMENRADYIFPLNNDTVVAPNFLKPMIKVAESNPTIGVVSPSIYFYDYNGKKDVVWYRGGTIRWQTASISHTDYGKQGFSTSETPIETGYICGCAMLIKKEVIEKIGMFYEKLFIYSEDADLSFRIKQGGYKLVIVPCSTIWHKVSKTMGRASPNSTYLSFRNMLWMVKRNFSTFQFFVFAMATLVKHPIWVARFIYRKQFENILPFYRGILEGLIYT